MAIFFLNETECGICGKVIKKGEPYQAFPPFVDNECDALYFFCDAVFHKTCVDKHPLGQAAIQRLELIRKLTSNNGKKCFVCQDSLDNPNDYFMLGFFTDKKEDPLYTLNCKAFHKRCLSKWEGLKSTYKLLYDMYNSQMWKGWGPKLILRDLKRAIEECTNSKD
jgi:hypothetical protein